MRFSRDIRYLLLTTLTLLLVPNLPAPIYGIFPGLGPLIERSDAIVVAEITATSADRLTHAGMETQIPQRSFGLYEDCEITVLRSLMGDLTEGQECVVGLRSLPIPGVGVSEFSPGSWHLLFLQREAPFSPYEPFGEPAIAFSQNCEGATFPLAPGTDLFPESQDSPEIMIGQIVRDSSERWEDENMRESAAIFLADLDSAMLALDVAVRQIAARAEADDVEYFTPLLEASREMSDPASNLIRQIKSSEMAETYRDRVTDLSETACRLNYHWLERGCHFQVVLVRVNGEWRVERFWFCR